MGKIIYVNGNILVKTRYFKQKNGGAYFPTPPDGAEIWEINKTDEHGSYYEISNENPQSVFNEYYAKEEFTTYDNWVSYLHRDLGSSYNSYKQRIDEILELISVDSDTPKHKNLQNRLYYIYIVASLDTFICDSILAIITSDEAAFERYADSIPCNQINMKSVDMKKQNSAGILEQRIFTYTRMQSYCNVDTIKKSYKKICNASIVDTNGLMNKYFNMRHTLVHRNGRNDRDEFITISNETLHTLIDDTKGFVDQIMSKIST